MLRLIALTLLLIPSPSGALTATCSTAQGPCGGKMASLHITGTIKPTAGFEIAEADLGGGQTFVSVRHWRHHSEHSYDRTYSHIVEDGEYMAMVDGLYRELPDNKWARLETNYRFAQGTK